MKIKFTKMHGLGNDFILIDARRRPLRQAGNLAGKLCDRRFGIGADQLLLLRSSRRADFRMQVYNADGSEVEMCGNGIRCLAKYIWDNKLTKNRGSNRILSIETLAGIIRPEKAGRMVKVDMGEPGLDGKDIPVKISGRVLNHPLKIKNNRFRMTCVSMGNPHAIIVAKDVDSVPLSAVGPLIASNRLFPEGTNVEFIQVLNRSNIKMRVWERGAGETMACGTGASAAGVASNILGLTNRKVTIHLPGGKLLIEWPAKDNHVYMTGPAETVFEGTIET